MNGPSRRTVLAAGPGAAIAFATPAAKSLPPWIPDSRMLRAMLQPDLDALGDLARVERLGSSRQGRPIELITIGRGARSVLVVGAPHANEPLGCLTVARFIRRLATDRRFREGTDATWHFIPAIDVDGLDMNAGWFGGKPTLRRYLRNFYRPAFALQPEYSFPLDVPGYRFDASTPENLCWQRALEISRPVLQSSLHGADSGGSFYFISRDLGGLAARLSAQPAEAGVSLNGIGEGDADAPTYAPGVFSFDKVLGGLRAKPGAPASSSSWSAGASSAEFTSERYGTFSVLCEIPIWQDLRELSKAPSAFTMAEVLRSTRRICEENLRLLDGGARLFATVREDPTQQALAAALREAAVRLPMQVASLAAEIPAADDRRPIAQCDVPRVFGETELIRPAAMLSRLAVMQGDKATSGAAFSLVDTTLSRLQSRTRLTPVPFEASTGLQMRAILTTLECLMSS